MLQKHLLTKNIIEQSNGIASTELLHLNAATIDFSDYDINSSANKILIDKLTIISEANDNIGQAYFFGPEIIEGNKSKILMAPKNIIMDGGRLGNLYKQPKEWIDCAKKVIKTKSSSYTTVYTDLYGTWVTTLHPVIDKYGRIIAIFGIDMKASIIQQGQHQLTNWLIAIIVFIIFLLIPFQYYVLKRIFTPLNSLLFGIKEISKGNFDIEIKVNKHNDLSFLIENFSQMVKSLRELFENLSKTSILLDEKIISTTDLGRSEPLSSHSFNFPDIPQLESAIRNIEKIKERTLTLEEIQHRQKINSIKDLAGAFAHELRNPCTTIKGFLQFFLQNEDMNLKTRDLMELMFQEVNQIEKIINEYVELARKDKGEISTIDISEKLKSILCLFFNNSSHQIIIKQDIEESIYIKANITEITQMLFCLIQNSIDSMQSEGVLSISAFKKNDKVILNIFDTGTGMTKEEINRLGTLFYSIKTKGTGLEFMKIYNTIEKVNGKITVNSNEKQGTNVSIEIPLASNPNSSILSIPR